MTDVDAGSHWEHVYRTRPESDLSWYQERPEASLRLLAPYATPTGAVLDAGAGASRLADGLLEQGWGQVTCLDVSAQALVGARARLVDDPRAAFVVGDLLTWTPDRPYDAWHDRAVFHFLTDGADQQRYVAVAQRALAPGGALVVGTFAEDGPQSCSSLPTARYDPEQLAAVFGSGFSTVAHEREEHRTPQGARQQFSWLVLRRR